jgi:LexA-binding, inner membrane-associated putative hydrolase
MPSPIGHGLAGLTVHVLAARDRSELWNPRRAAIVVGAALAPDLDLLLRFVDGRNHHQGATHGIGAALLAAAVVALAAPALGAGRRLALSVAAGSAWLSHLLLDYLGSDTHPPIGLMALWPFSDAYFKAPWPIFLDIGRTLEWATVQNNLLAGAWEIAVLVPLLLLAWRLRSSGKA